jgi:D-glycero-D-manno-heptose 1,7-bisphosphate phosphatase
MIAHVLRREQRGKTMDVRSAQGQLPERISAIGRGLARHRRRRAEQGGHKAGKEFHAPNYESVFSPAPTQNLAFGTLCLKPSSLKFETAQPRAVFLDRDGVLIEDVDLLTQSAQVRPLPGAAAALRRLKDAGFLLLVVSNQAVVARGLATESEVDAINAEISQRLQGQGAPALDAFYFCPHHPKATLESYRKDCLCRKPRPGMLRAAASDFHLDLARSFMVGDRMTDIAAGAAAGCRTILVHTGKHAAPPIETIQPLAAVAPPDWTCPDLPAAAEWILAQ